MDSFEGLKRELLVVTVLCVIALLVVLGLRLPPAPSIAWLGGIGIAAAAWLVLRTHRLARKLGNRPPQGVDAE